MLIKLDMSKYTGMEFMYIKRGWMIVICEISWTSQVYGSGMMHIAGQSGRVGCISYGLCITDKRYPLTSSLFFKNTDGSETKQINVLKVWTKITEKSLNFKENKNQWS